MTSNLLCNFQQDQISAIINQPLQTSNRIKFTCFDVSSKYIVFGATSGGVYIYNRKPCNFIKLLPSKEGRITNILIADDDKIAISTVKGLILILSQPISITNGEFLVFTEHENNTITTMKWHKNSLYTGDNSGNVAVTDLSTNFKTTLFKVPSALLMKFDSSIVQLDTYMKYLLISTETKTYLCDTNEEFYKLIGTKLRNGPFGCCFLNHVNPHDTADVKIISARPGCRLWEANLACQVLRTHQFKELLVERNPACIIILKDEVQFKKEDNNLLTDFDNFKLLFVIDDKFILTFNSVGLYIFNLDSVEVYSWMCDNDHHIRDVKVVDNLIYIWTDNSDVILLIFTSLPNLLRRVVNRKQFDVCSNICLHFKETMLKHLEENEDLHFLNSVKIHYEENNDSEALENLHFIFNRLNVKDDPNWSLENGIHVLKNVKIADDLVETNSDGSNNNGELVINVESDPFSDINLNLNNLYKNYKLNCTDMRKTHSVFNMKSSMEIVKLLQQFLEKVKQIDDDKRVAVAPEVWCHNQFLYYLQESSLNFTTDAEVVLYTTEAFKSVNAHDVRNCSTCSFPLPDVRKVPTYYDIGCAIVGFIHSDEKALSSLLVNIPYMWKHFLTRNVQYSRVLLPIIIQFGDDDVLEHFVPHFTYDDCDEAIRSLIKLKNGSCLNCDKPIAFDARWTFDWTRFCVAITKQVGGIGSIELLKRHADDLPSDEIGIAFYQTCIFSAIANNVSGSNGLNRQSVDFMREMHGNGQSSVEISGLLNRYLMKKHTASSKESTDHEINRKRSGETSALCTFCKLPMSMPILNNDAVDLICDHPYHELCYTHQNKICSICANK